MYQTMNSFGKMNKCLINEQKKTTQKQDVRYNFLPYENFESRQLSHQDISLIVEALYLTLF